MSKVLATLPDAEKLVIDYLVIALAARNVTATVGVVIPATWTKASTQHVQVALDGTSSNSYPVKADVVIRITAWTGTPTAAKALANLCEGLMLSCAGYKQMGSVLPGTGVIATRDADTKAEIASFTVEAHIRYIKLS
jgi:hypothetical protein